MKLLSLALKSLWNRRMTAFLCAFSIALSVALFLCVERVRNEARTSFQSTIAGVDLLVGARTGGVQLLLYTVFRIGNATNNVSWESYQEIANHREVSWSVPMSLGDSHRGFRVLGTTPEYFTRYKFAGGRSLEFGSGAPFAGVFDAVIGSEVAAQLSYSVGSSLILAHGVSAVSLQQHGDKPFRVAGVLKRTGTPIDRTVHVSLAGIEAIHLDWRDGAPPLLGQALSPAQVAERDLTPKVITAFLLGLKSKIGIFRVQREINEYRREPLLAVLPGATLQELWSTVAVAESALRFVSLFVVIAGFIGMLTTLLATLGERRREIAILRSVGANPLQISLLLVFESTLLTLFGILGGLAMVVCGLAFGAGALESQYGIIITSVLPSFTELLWLGVILLGGLLLGVVPAWRAYRNALSDGLSIRL